MEGSMSLFVRPKWKDLISPTLRRRLIGLSAATASVLLLTWLVDCLQSRLVDTSFFTGYLLLGCVLFLAAFQIRKRIPAPPLGSAALWLQIHIYVGLAVMGVFVLHAGVRWPTGWVETPLAALFCFLCASGLYGLYISRTIPPKLAALREQVIFERIPQAARKLAGDAFALAGNESLCGAELASIYRTSIAPFLSRPRGVWYWLRPSGEGWRRQVIRLQDSHRYLNTEQLRIAQQLESLVRQKDDLDFHAAMQGRLKLWLWGHIGATYAMLTLALVHGVMAHAFHGGAR
jgi:hypothetical protein